MPFFTFVIAVLLVFSPFQGKGQVIKSWKIDSFQVNLIRQQHVQESYNASFNAKKTYYTFFEIKKNHQSITIGGTIQVSPDSCEISFLELPKLRVKNGLVGVHYFLNLCSQTLKSSKIYKPSWEFAAIQSPNIIPLDSLFHNPYSVHQPFAVKSFSEPKAQVMHPKVLEGFLLFFNDAYLVAPYVESDFQKPHQVQFEITFTHKGNPQRVLLYWKRFLVNGYVYDMGGIVNEPFCLKIWESNLKLLGIN